MHVEAWRDHHQGTRLAIGTPHFFAALRATRAVLPAMRDQGAGAVINIASVNAFFEPDPGVLDYGAAKAALLNLTKSLAQEFGPKGIR